MEASNPSLLMFGKGNIIDMRVANEQVVPKFHMTLTAPHRDRNYHRPYAVTGCTTES
jgi:hypothetical protein